MTNAKCDKCGEIEPEDHDESWWLCDCQKLPKQSSTELIDLMNKLEAEFNNGKR